MSGFSTRMKGIIKCTRYSSALWITRDLRIQTECLLSIFCVMGLRTHSVEYQGTAGSSSGQRSYIFIRKRTSPSLEKEDVFKKADIAQSILTFIYSAMDKMQ